MVAGTRGKIHVISQVLCGIWHGLLFVDDERQFEQEVVSFFGDDEETRKSSAMGIALNANLKYTTPLYKKLNAFVIVERRINIIF